MKYSDAFLKLSQVIADSGLALHPVDFTGEKTPPFGNVDMIPSTPGVNYGSISGIVMIDIYVVGGEGPSKALAFADDLDDHLVKKSHEGLQLFQSSCVPRGPSKVNPGWTRYEYTVRFKFFGP